MYNIKDYVNRGLMFANNTLFPRRKKLSTLMFYSTNLCNSKCKHCFVWAQRPVVHISKAKMVEIMSSKCVSQNTTIGLEGGEFLLHPEANEILQWFSENHKNFELLSNCLQARRVIDTVKKYPPKRLYLSLDGDRETYLYMRGADGFDKVIQVIEGCKDIVPVSLMFTLSPYNSFDDLNFVVEIAKKYNIDIRIGIYNNIDFFDTVDTAHVPDTKQKNQDKDTRLNSNYLHCSAENIPENVKDTSENYDFLILYNEWRTGKLKLNCYSIFDSLVIHPNGNVPLCQNLDVKLGNIYEKSLDSIYNSKDSIELQKKYAKTCNQCWINFHRKYDIVLLRSLEKFIPKPIIQLFYGKYRWTDNQKLTYKQVIS
ncbi:MAG: radical SAM protein [Prevotellaceae bacterium]|jgi:MoaA/NifB/PqqE/SkfB family radical SAM enzyme|nr:radical SAM protein [Prevotellaceae bacterium]